MLAPICLFTYNRLEETQITINALQKNYLAPNSNLFIFSDGPKNESAQSKVNRVREYLKSINGFNQIKIYESKENKGLANSIIQGVTKIVKKYGKVIVLEDDLISSPNFLDFMNQALNFYLNDTKVKSVNGYSLSLKNKKSENYFQIRPFPWGWATWEDRWDESFFDKKKISNLISKDKSLLKKFDNACGNDISRMLLNSILDKNDSWYVRWTFQHFLSKEYSLFPAFSFIYNIGHNNEGTHCKGINSYKSIMVDEKLSDFKFKNFEYPDMVTKKQFIKYFSLRHKLLLRLQLIVNKKGRQLLFDEIRSRVLKSND